MNPQQLILALVGAVVSIILAMILVRHSKNTITKTMSRRHILRMLKTKRMNGKELTYTAREYNSDVISYKMIPVLLVKLEEEGLVQKTSSNEYAITTKGIEALNEIEAMSKEFQKIASIMNKTSMIGKFMINEALDRMAMMNVDKEELKPAIR